MSFDSLVTKFAIIMKEIEIKVSGPFDPDFCKITNNYDLYDHDPFVYLYNIILGPKPHLFYIGRQPPWRTRLKAF